MNATKTAQTLVEQGILKKILHTEEEVNDRITELAEEILATYSDQLPTFVALERGGLFFAERIVEKLTELRPLPSPNLATMIVSRYDSRAERDVFNIIADVADPKHNIQGKSCLVLDDVFDKGKTAQFVHDHLINSWGATQVNIAVLSRKDVSDRGSSVTIEPQFIGFEDPDEWLVGCGMNLDRPHDPEAFRFLAVIGVAADAAS